MGQNKNFIAARLPQELYDRLDSITGDKKGEKTRIIIEAIAAYLDFPLKSSDTAVDNNEKFVALESRMAELEQQFQEFKSSVISRNLSDNNIKPSVIASEKSCDSVDNKRDNKPDNKNAIVLQSDGSIDPTPESQLADFIGISNRALGYHRKKLQSMGKPLNQPKRIEYNSQLYDLICQGESKIRGKTVFLWTAKPVIETDNNIYQPDIIEYQPDNHLTNSTEVSNQKQQKQDSESSKLSDNNNYQVLSGQPDTNQESNEQNSQSSQAADNVSYQTLSIDSIINQEENEEKEHHLEGLDSLDNTSYQRLSVEFDTNQEETNQDLQNLDSADNSSYQSLSVQPDFNEQPNEQQQDSDKQTAEHQPELPKEEQPEF